MSLDLTDLKRLKITAETAAWLRAEAHVTGRSPQEILRDAVHDIALQKIHAAKVLANLAPAQGHAGDAGGSLGAVRGRQR
jgi:hypothetical protein